jgi:hypothetical protein
VTNNSRDLFQKSLGVIDVLNHLDTDCLIELLVPARELFRSGFDFSKWQTTLL